MVILPTIHKFTIAHTQLNPKFGLVYCGSYFSCSVLLRFVSKRPFSRSTLRVSGSHAEFAVDNVRQGLSRWLIICLLKYNWGAGHSLIYFLYCFDDLETV